MMRMCSSGKISAEGHCDIVMLLSPPRVFLPINDQQTVPLEGTKTCLKARSIETGTSVARPF